MNKNTFQIGLIICLAISNILLGIYAFNSKGQHRPHHDDKPRNLIIEKLHLDEAQTKQYDILIKDHRTQIAAKDHQIMRLKNELYQHLKEDKPLATADSLTQEIARVQKQIESIHFAHFIALKKLCTPQQQGAYKELANELAKIFSHTRPPRR
jgi:periplasmic protein CpxP/Spy